MITNFEGVKLVAKLIIYKTNGLSSSIDLIKKNIIYLSNIMPHKNSFTSLLIITNLMEKSLLILNTVLLFLS